MYLTLCCIVALMLSPLPFELYIGKPMSQFVYHADRQQACDFIQPYEGNIKVPCYSKEILHGNTPKQLKIFAKRKKNFHPINSLVHLLLNFAFYFHLLFNFADAKHGTSLILLTLKLSGGGHTLKLSGGRV